MTPRRRAAIAWELLTEAVTEVLDAADWPPRNHEVAQRLSIDADVAYVVLHAMAVEGRIHQPRGPYTGWASSDGS